MNPRKVSIIVPIHNEEKYLKRCIDSIISQTYTELEIILIDDGSEDDSGQIIEEYIQLDNRIQVFHKNNMGVSAARNFGLNQATGYYIQFVDSDDYITTHTTEKMVKILEKEESDLAVCSYTRLFKGFNLKLFHFERRGTYSNQEYLCNTLKDPGHHYYGVTWNKLYKKEIVKRYEITFREDVRLGEDFIFNLQYLKHIKLVSVIQDSLYYYNCENGDTLSRYKKTLTTCKQELEYRRIIFTEFKKVFNDLGLYDQYEKKIQQYWRMYYIRNKYYIDNDFSEWRYDEIEEWKSVFINNEDIQKCIIFNSRIKILLLSKWVCIKIKLVMLIKNLLNK